MKKIIISIIAILVIGAGSTFAFFTLSGNGKYTFELVERGTFQKVIEASGKVEPIREAHLGFEASGTVIGTYAKVGDVVKKGQLLVQLDASSIRSQLSKAEADLQLEIATLNDLSLDLNSTELLSSKQSMIAALQNAYTTSDNMIKTKTDQFFEDSYLDEYPKIIEAQRSGDIEASLLNSLIDRQREDIGKMLPIWREKIRSLEAETLTQEDINYAKENLKTILNFMDNVVQSTNNYTNPVVLSDSKINEYRELASTARSNIQNSYSDIISKEESLRSVNSRIPIQESKIASADANLQEYKVQLSKTDIRAPFDGIISQQDAEVGEIAQSGTSLVSMIGSDGLKLEVFIPEVNISGVRVDQDAEVILDAYGEDVKFNAKVALINPTETEKEGISTYKTTFYFNEKDERIRSGMTADATITTDKKEGVILVPRRAIIDGKVLVEENGDIIEKNVEVGNTDSFGNYEVISGLEEGDKVVLNP